MTAPHFFSERIDGNVVRLAGDEARHASRALRIRPGEAITVSDGEGSVVEARVLAASADELTAEVVSRRTVERALPSVVVYPALPKGGKLDIVVQKLTEIGVDAVRPWPAERSIVRWSDAKSEAQGDRLRAIAREAAKQSRRAWLPVVANPATPRDLPALTVVLHEHAEHRLSQLLPDDSPEQIGVVVGPEGGLTDEEVGLFKAAGAVVAVLGPQILRAETAAIVGPALVMATYKRLG